MSEIRFTVQVGRHWLHMRKAETSEQAFMAAMRAAANHGEAGPVRVRVYAGERHTAYPGPDPLLDTWAASCWPGPGRFEVVSSDYETECAELIGRTMAGAAA